MPTKKTTKPTPKKTVAKKPSKIAAAGRAVSAQGKSVAKKFLTALKSAGSSVVKKAKTKYAAVKASSAKKSAAKKVLAKKSALPPAKLAIRSTVTKSKPAAKPVVKVAAKAETIDHRLQTTDTQSLTLIARDPRWLYAEWDFSRAQQTALNKKAAAGHLALRVRRDNYYGALVKEASLAASAKHVFLPIARGETTYVAELGYRDAAGKWVSVARSGAVTTPSEELAGEGEVEFATIPQDVPFKDVFEKIGAQIAADVPLVEVVRKFRALLPGFAITPAGTGWTPQKIRTLSRLAGVRQIRRRLESELSSLTAAHIIETEEKIYTDDELDAASSPNAAWSGDLA
ncbi:MAG: hypothetical protein RLZZ350_1077 [Verrucomicrobiota bacterium]|jgi:hypothetical protein